MYKSTENKDGNEHDRMRNEYKEGQTEDGQSEMPDKHFVHMGRSEGMCRVQCVEFCVDRNRDRACKQMVAMIAER
jgi:hypothetical protein